MHELSITQELLDLALSEANKVSAIKIGKINLVIGEMSGVVDECVRFYFDFLSKDTIAQGATLNIKKVLNQALCRDCGREFELEEFNWVCPYCKGSELDITHGSELFLESIEVEQDGDKGTKEHSQRQRPDSRRKPEAS